MMGIFLFINFHIMKKINHNKEYEIDIFVNEVRNITQTKFKECNEVLISKTLKKYKYPKRVVPELIEAYYYSDKEYRKLMTMNILLIMLSAVLFVLLLINI